MKNRVLGFFLMSCIVVTSTYLFRDRLFLIDKNIASKEISESNISENSKKSDNSNNEKNTQLQNKSNDTKYNPMIMLVNKKYQLEENFIPSDLTKVDIPFIGGVSSEESQMVYEAAKALEKLVNKAVEDDIYFYGVSGYRSYNTQKYVYDLSISNNGYDYTEKYVAIPGKSEHQIGLAMDLGDSKGQLIQEGKKEDWIVNNAYKYGFILRYPKGKEDITGYNYEPWHIRYVGVKVAEEIHNRNITLEEFYN